jgi:hypothetical protein
MARLPRSGGSPTRPVRALPQFRPIVDPPILWYPGLISGRLSPVRKDSVERPAMETAENVRWLREAQQRAGDLRAALRQRVATVPRSGCEQWFDELRDRFEHLRAHVQKHMALEECGGYLVAVLEHRPTLYSKVDRLRSEHRQLARVMDGIHQALRETKATDPLLVTDSCARIQQLLSYLEQHESHENLMVLSVFTEDVGLSD